MAERESRVAGLEWLHVDFEEELRDFYVAPEMFSTPAGRMSSPLVANSASTDATIPSAGVATPKSRCSVSIS